MFNLASLVLSFRSWSKVVWPFLETEIEMLQNIWLISCIHQSLNFFGISRICCPYKGVFYKTRNWSHLDQLLILHNLRNSTSYPLALFWNNFSWGRGEMSWPLNGLPALKMVQIIVLDFRMYTDFISSVCQNEFLWY